jgi:hypothetical protein
LDDEDAIRSESKLAEELDGGLSFNESGAECAAWFEEREVQPTHATTVAIKISAFSVQRSAFGVLPMRDPAAETLSRND